MKTAYVQIGFRDFDRQRIQARPNTLEFRIRLTELRKIGRRGWVLIVCKAASLLELGGGFSFHGNHYA